MKNLCMRLLVCVYFFSNLLFYVYPVVKGSEATLSIQPFVTFLSTDQDNSMVGFSWFKNGFALENASTTCTFDAAFPVSGPILLNGGTLCLKSDLILDGGTHLMSFGNIYGNSRTLVLPKTIKTLSFSSIIPGENQKFTYIGQAVAAAYSDARDIESLDWSYDDKYITAVSEKNISIAYSELKELLFDGLNLSVLHSEALASGAYAVRWHPYQKSFAVHGNWSLWQSGQLKIFKESKPNVFTESCSIPFYYDVTAFDWHPTGSYLAVGCVQNYPEIHVYPYEDGILNGAKKCTCDLPGYTDVSTNAISWNGKGNYLVCGKCCGVGSELNICFFNESSIVVEASKDFNADVSAVDWLPETDLIAVGLSGAGEGDHLRLYSYVPASKQITLILSCAEKENITALQWSPDKTMLLVGAGSLVKIFLFNSATMTFELLQTIVSPNNTPVSGVRWSHSGTYILFGQRNGTKCNAYVYGKSLGEDKGLWINNTNLSLDANLTISGRMVVQGNCVIAGNGNQLIFDKNLSVEIAQGSSLTLENVCVVGLKENNLRCVSPDGRLILTNCELLLSQNYSFSVGSIQFESCVGINGGYVFSYESTQASTIEKNATLLVDSGSTLHYCPVSNRDDLLVFQDKTSRLTLNNSILHISSMGLSVKKGVLLVQGISFLSALGAYLTLGDGIFDDDFDCKIENSAKFEILQGALNYKNIADAAMFLGSVQSVLQFDSHATFNLYETCSLGNGKLVFEDGASFFKIQGKTHRGTTLILGRLTCGSL